MKNKIVLLIILLMSIFNVYAETDINIDNKKVAVKITKILDSYETEDGIKFQNIEGKILSGKDKGKIIAAEFCLESYDMIEVKSLEVGEKVVVMKDAEIGDKIIVVEKYRQDVIIILILIFMGLILCIGGKQGIKTLVSLGATLLTIVYILIPGIMNGMKAMPLTIACSIIITFITLILVGGFNKKTLVSILGTVGGVIIAGTLVIFFSKIGNITGMMNEEARLLLYASQEDNIDVQGLFFAGIILGTLGATMDITMSISSAMTEIMTKAKKISIKELLKSGYTVGKDAMGTMSNTLILAYVGESLILIILLIYNNSSDPLALFNSDFLTSELLRSICGTIGMISAIPLTTLIFGLLSAKDEDII